jgi:hypothetical protein
MSCNADKRARAEAMLGELAELGLMLARDLAVQARSTEDPQEKVALVGAFQKTSRMVRLTLALDFKLERDAARAARDEQAAARAEQKAAENDEARSRAVADRATCHVPSPVERQKARVRSVLNRLLWNESEGDTEEYDILVEDLNARLDEAAQAPGFEDLAIEVLAARLKADMRLGGELVVTTAAAMTAANRAEPPLADTG